MGFKDKTVLITGAAVGIGRACALLFARENANVVLVDLNKETLSETEKEIKEITDNYLSIICDVSNNNEVISAVEKVNNRLPEQKDSCNRLSHLHCHCEPVRTLAWQSPGTINRSVGTKIYELTPK